MDITTALLNFILNLLGNEEAREAFEADPDAALAAAGLGGIEADDVDAILPILFDSTNVSSGRSYDTGANVATGASGGNVTAVGGGGHYVSSHDAAVHQISYVVNNTTFVDDRDTIFDNSVNQAFILGEDAELELNQTFDNDNVIGNGNVVGDGNDVIGGGAFVNTGDGNNFGDGTLTDIDVEQTDVDVDQTNIEGDVVGGNQVSGDQSVGGGVENSIVDNVDQSGAILPINDVLSPDINIPILSGNDVEDAT